MMRFPRLSVEALPDETLDLALVKSFIRVAYDDDDALIAMMVKSAVDWAENATHRTLIARGHEWTLQAFPYADKAIRLPRGKTVSVDSIAYVRNRVTVTMTGATSSPAVSEDFQEDLSADSGGVLAPLQGQDWPDVDCDAIAPVRIAFTAGYEPEALPAQLLHAVLMAATDAYDLRGSADMGLDKAGAMLEARQSIVSQWLLARWH